ncbi:DUF2184 domain-containing protein [Parablautia intestinalis]|uniref:DUF2184 domain-containing protein n=1 Tax=Parablautia intestinalis TaxID=2320100 RepID=A0A3A9AFM0_9FIRM|nr:DUF2184 domain-containing protein [Parablautia intestinalis]RKI90440.1 DUF2184 domain-containing protein [Parablautia intestinalis]
MNRNRHLSYDRADEAALRNGTICSTLKRNWRNDGIGTESASVFFARELDYVKAQTYDIVHPEMTALSLFPVSNEVPEGAESFTYYSYDRTGLATIINNYATDLPRADVKGKPVTGYVKSIGDSYGYSVQELRASKMTGKSLDVRKGESARYAADYLINKLAWMGSKENNLIGILSEENDIPKFVLSTVMVDGEEKTEFCYKNADQILEDLNNMQKYVSQITKNVEKPDTLVLPAHVYIDLATRRIPDTDTTILKFLMDNAPYLKEIREANELQADSTDMNPTGSNVGLLYTNSEKKMTLEIPMPFLQHTLQENGLEIVIPCEERVAGMVIYYPLSALIVEGI